jgi:hypothetical protein
MLMREKSENTTPAEGSQPMAIGAHRTKARGTTHGCVLVLLVDRCYESRGTFRGLGHEKMTQLGCARAPGRSQALTLDSIQSASDSIPYHHPISVLIMWLAWLALACLTIGRSVFGFLMRLKRSTPGLKLGVNGGGLSHCTAQLGPLGKRPPTLHFSFASDGRLRSRD